MELRSMFLIPTLQAGPNFRAAACAVGNQTTD